MRLRTNFRVNPEKSYDQNPIKMSIFVAFEALPIFLFNFK